MATSKLFTQLVNKNNRWKLAIMFFFLCFRWARALDLGRNISKKENMCFFLSSACIELLPIYEKNT